jgi:transposase
MTISKEQQAEILRLYHVEKWRVGTIANQLNLHASTVRRTLAQDGHAPIAASRPRLIDEHLPFINHTLKEYPTLTATRLFMMVTARGYQGKISQFRSIIKEIRPKRREAFLRLDRIQGEEAQVDWGHFGSIDFEGYQRPLVAFVMTLSYSRAIFIRFFVSQSMSCFLQGHESAFSWFQGVPKHCLYDNLKSVVLERIGSAIKLNPQMVSYSQHRRFSIRVAAPARGNEKGRTERAIRYVRDNFFAGRKFKDIEDLNQQAIVWCATVSLERDWQDDRTQKVKDALASERQVLVPLCEPLYPCEERRDVSIGKTPYVRFDLNDYSVPHRYVHTVVSVFASEESVRIVSGTETIGTHLRRYTKGMRYDNHEHIRELREWKRLASNDNSIDDLMRCIGPSVKELFDGMSEHDYSMLDAKRSLRKLLEMYGASELTLAIQEALRQGEYRVSFIRQRLETRRAQAGKAAVLPLILPDHAHRHDLAPIKQHELGQYEQLTTRSVNGGTEDGNK